MGMNVGDLVGPYQLVEKIGKGSFATVYRATGPSNSLVAVKAVVRSKLTPKLLESLESEIRLLRALPHPHVVALRDCFKTDANIFLVMDYCNAGDLARFIQRRGEVSGLHPDSVYLYPHPPSGGLNLTLCRAFIAQLAFALEFLRQHDILHRDIKPQNLLLQIDPDPNQPIPLLRVADFGFARLLPQSSLAETLCGSPLYMAPEILRYEKYDAKADLWSAGAVIYEMVTGRPPFRAANHVELLRKIERSAGRIRFPDEVDPDPARAQTSRKDEPPPQPVPDDLKLLIRSLLRLNPVERVAFPTFFQAVKDIIPPSMVLPIGQDKSSSSYPSIRPDQAGAFTRPNLAKPEPHRPNSEVPTPQRKSSYNSPSPMPSGDQPIFFAPKYYVGGNESDSTSRASKRASIPPSHNPVSVPIERTRSSSSTTPKIASDSVAHHQRPLPSTAIEDSGELSTIGKEYVLIEKSVVEVNALADELAASPRNAIPSTRRRASRTVLNKPLGHLTPNPTTSTQSGNAPPKTTPANPFDNVDPEDDTYFKQWPLSKPTPDLKPSYDFSTPPPFARTATGTSASDRSTKRLSQKHYSNDGATADKGANLIANTLKYSPPRSSPLTNEAFGTLPPVTNALTGHLLTPATNENIGLTNKASFPSNALTRALQVAANSSGYTFSSPLKFFSAATSGSYPFSSSNPKSKDEHFNWYWLTHFLRLRKGRDNRKGSSPLSQSSYEGIETDVSRSSDSAEARVLDEIEDYAQKASVLFDLADEKLLRFLPPPPSVTGPGWQKSDDGTTAADQSALIRRASPFVIGTGAAEDDGGKHRIQPDQAIKSHTKSISAVDGAEALQLYIKALAFLRKGINRAKEYIDRAKSAKRYSSENKLGGQGFINNASPDLNEFVQWFRARFNECLDKAHFAKACCAEQKSDFVRPVQKVIYEGALETSRSAAVNELQAASPEVVEMAYEKALWMLYALIDPVMSEPDEKGISRTKSGNMSIDSTSDHPSHQHKVPGYDDRSGDQGFLSNDGEGEAGLDSKDMETLKKFIDSIQGRLSALRSKDMGIFGDPDALGIPTESK